MQVAKWGNSLAVRLPAAVVEALELREGEEIEIHVADSRSKGAMPLALHHPWPITDVHVGERQWPGQLRLAVRRRGAMQEGIAPYLLQQRVRVEAVTKQVDRCASLPSAHPKSCCIMIGHFQF
jgi:hypothetical protein